MVFGNAGRRTAQRTLSTVQWHSKREWKRTRIIQRKPKDNGTEGGETDGRRHGISNAVSSREGALSNAHLSRNCYVIFICSLSWSSLQPDLKCRSNRGGKCSSSSCTWSLLSYGWCLRLQQGLNHRISHCFFIFFFVYSQTLIFIIYHLFSLLRIK